MTLEIKKDLSYIQISEAKNELIWNQLRKVKVYQALEKWLDTLSPLTKLNYASGMHILSEYGFINLDFDLQQYCLVNHDAVLDQIKNFKRWSEATRQSRCSCYISFSRFLNRKTEGMIKKVIPCREGSTKTFFKIREKVKTNAMNRHQWIDFLQELYKINHRDCLIAKLALQGGKRINEVLKLTIDMIDFSTREITFDQSKTFGYEKQTVITYSKEIIEELKDYVGDRDGYVFITSNNKKVHSTQLTKNFENAGIRAKIPFKVTPHVLRASAITYLKREGFSDSEIMKVTGHTSAQMVNAYDKSERANNPTKKINMV